MNQFSKAVQVKEPTKPISKELAAERAKWLEELMHNKIPMVKPHPYNHIHNQNLYEENLWLRGHSGWKSVNLLLKEQGGSRNK